MVPVLLILIPLITGAALFAVKQEATAKSIALLATLLSLALMLAGMSGYIDAAQMTYDQPWLGGINSRFHFALDGMSQLLCLLTTLSFPIIIYSTWNNQYDDSNRFYGLVLLSQAGLLGVFMALDALLFYFFWELALIPLYFLCSRWGGERRRRSASRVNGSEPRPALFRGRLASLSLVTRSRTLRGKCLR